MEEGRRKERNRMGIELKVTCSHDYLMVIQVQDRVSVSNLVTIDLVEYVGSMQLMKIFESQ